MNAILWVTSVARQALEERLPARAFPGERCHQVATPTQRVSERLRPLSLEFYPKDVAEVFHLSLP